MRAAIQSSQLRLRGCRGGGHRRDHARLLASVGAEESDKSDDIEGLAGKIVTLVIDTEARE